MGSRKINMRMDEQKSAGLNTWADTDLPLSSEDRILLNQIGEYVMAEADIKEVMNDPMFAETNSKVKQMIRNRNINSVKGNAVNGDFIMQSLSGNDNNKAENGKNEIDSESSKEGIDKITLQWVKDWNEKAANNNPETETRKDIREFIVSSLEERKNNREPGKVIPLRWIAASAAAVAGAILLFRALLPGGNTDRLYNKYYEPMNIVSSVTRSAEVNASVIYNQAVESYKSHNYGEAVAGFTIASEGKDPGGAAYFCLGLSHAALENYTEAVSILEKVVSAKGDFVKDAQWYLGLVYLKTGEQEKAGKCFEALSSGPGFYSDRSARILRRLK